MKTEILFILGFVFVVIVAGCQDSGSDYSSSYNTQKRTSTGITQIDKRAVEFRAEKYSDGNLAIMLSIFDKNGNCDWVNGDLEVVIKDRNDNTLSTKKFNSVSKASYMCVNSDSTSEIYVGTDISKVYKVSFIFNANSETYSKNIILGGFS